MNVHDKNCGDVSTEELLRCLICRVLCEGRPAAHRVTRMVTYQFKGISFTAKGDHMSTVIKDTDVPGTMSVSIAFVDGKGKPAKVDGVPTWAASNPNVIDSVTPAADGMSAVVHVLDNIDVSQLTVSADVDLGSGVNSVDFVDSVSVIAGDAVAANFTFGAVTPDTPAPTGVGPT